LNVYDQLKQKSNQKVQYFRKRRHFKENPIFKITAFPDTQIKIFKDVVYSLSKNNISLGPYFWTLSYF